MALGAGQGDVVRLISRQGAWFAIGGLIFGLIGAGLVVPVMQSAMWGWADAPLDPFVFVAAATILLLISLLASYLPARRATRVDPVIALREE
jgi:ABC-type antimicrobial peptide transport system permease subunit